MPIDTYAAFLVATVVLMLIPGPSVMLAVGVSLSHGFRVGMANVVGASGAVAVQMVILALGLTPILLFAGQWFEALRWAGVAYLLYLGLTQWRRAGVAPESTAAVRRGRRVFWHGFAVSALNPKSLLFFAAILPQFLDPARSPGPQLAVMGVTLVGTALVTTTLWAYFADRARILLRTPKAWTWRDRLSGTVMIAAGIVLAVAKR
ncbi:MAG: LysE family translocator [Alphaproteobacteria bacterium]